MTDRSTTYNHISFKTGGIAFCMEDGCLLIQPESSEYPLPLTAQATHRLLNLLFDNRQSIYDANVEAKKYGTQKHKPHKQHSDRRS